VAQVLDKKLDTFRTQTASAMKAGAAEVDPRLVQQLAALGYVGGGRTGESQGSEMTGADPKDKIEIANGVQDALMATQNGRPDDALRILEQIIKKDPELEVGYRTLGLTYLQRGDFEQAIPMLRKSVELNPGFSLGHLRLGQALFETHDLEGAKKETETAISKSGMVNLKYEATLHFFLAAILRQMGNKSDAFKELRVSDKLDPDNYKTNLTLGRLLAMDGDPTSGLPYLQKAARLDPSSFEPHLFLSDAYEQLGRQMEATAQRVEAERLQTQQKPD
jgi:tetratricopeptide (TPR) repeat protein